MGLDTSHNAFHASYSTFNDMRYWLAKQIGVNLDDYIGYGEKGFMALNTINHKLMPLFNHSDCDGVLTPDECKQIAEGIYEILNSLPEDKRPYSPYQLAKQFKEGCWLASALGEELDFH